MTNIVNAQSNYLAQNGNSKGNQIKEQLQSSNQNNQIV